MDILSRWGITAGGYVAAMALLWLFIGAKSDLKAEIERCNTEKLASIAEAEKIVRNAEREAADERVRLLQVELEREIASAENERQRRLQAEQLAVERDQALRKLAQEAFDEDELPDSNACLNAFISSRALRCVLHSKGRGEAGPGAGGDGALCSDPGGTDGVHTGFSNVTYLDALMHWGGDRSAAIRWNERAVAIKELQDELVED